jgi:hypothetical protein
MRPLAEPATLAAVLRAGQAVETGQAVDVDQADFNIMAHIVLQRGLHDVIHAEQAGNHPAQYLMLHGIGRGIHRLVQGNGFLLAHFLHQADGRAGFRLTALHAAADGAGQYGRGQDIQPLRPQIALERFVETDGQIGRPLG